MSPRPVAIIFGSGKNIGAAVTKKFVDANYRVAIVSRNASPTSYDSDTVLTIRADLTQPNQVATVFDAVQRTWDAFPEVVIWNAARRTPCADKNNIFSVPIPDVEADFAVANTSPWVAANEVVKNWKEGERRTFIYTGNLMARYIFPHPDFTTCGLAKRAAAYWLEVADNTYKSKGWRFYYADERNVEGGSPGNPPGAAGHADMFLELVEVKEERPSYVTFAKGVYQEFEVQKRL